MKTCGGTQAFLTSSGFGGKGGVTTLAKLSLRYEAEVG